MKLRTLTGTRYEARCADGCGAIIPASPDVKVVVDFDSRPRKTWIPAHSPDSSTWPPRWSRSESLPREPFPSGCERGSGSLGPDTGTWKGNAGNGHAEPAQGPTNGASGGFAPANSLPVVPPKAPEPPKAPSPPPPLALLGSDASHNEEEASASPQAGRAWSSGGLTVNPGKFESVRAGYADYALPGESAEQLAVRVNAVIEADLRSKLALLVRLHREFGIPGPEYLRSTSSPAPPAGALKGASATLCSPPTVLPSSTTQAVEEGPPRPGPLAVDLRPGRTSTTPRPGSAVTDLLARVQHELTDQGVKRSRAKRSAVGKLLELRGLRSLRECGPADERALRALLDNFGKIDDWDLHDGHGQAPSLDERLLLPA